MLKQFWLFYRRDFCVSVLVLPFYLYCFEVGGAQLEKCDVTV